MLSPPSYFLAVTLALMLSLTSCQAQTASSNSLPPPRKTSPGIFGIAFNRDGRTLATGNFNGTVNLWDVSAGRLLRTLDGHTDVVYKGVFSPDEKVLASCSRDGKIKLWDLATGRELRTLTGHTRPIKAVAFSPNGKLLASVSNDGTLRVWDVESGLEQRSFVHTKSTEVDDSVYALVFISHGNMIATGNGDGTISYWEVASGKEVRVLKGHTGAVFCLALSSDERWLASGSYDRTVRLWEVTSGNEIRTFADKKMEGVTEQVRAVSLSSDGKWLASSEVGSTQSGSQYQYVYKRVSVWNVKTGERILTLNQPKLEINGLAFSPDNRLLAGAGADGIIKLWNVKSGQEERSFPKAPAVAVSDLKPSRDNFFREVLDAKATSVTPRFDDYTEGSYHVDKLDLHKGLYEVAQKDGIKLRGLLVVGPVDMLWAYYVVAFIEEGEVIRVNALVMPHARITFKSTGTISQKRYDEFLSGVLQTKVLALELPPKGNCDTCPYPEWHYKVLLSDSSKDQPSVYYGNLDESRAGANVAAFEKEVNSLLASLKQTYPVKRAAKNRSRRV